MCAWHAWLATGAVVVTLSGCGADDCPSQLVLRITEPGPGALVDPAADRDAASDGIQVDVAFASSLPAGERVLLGVGPALAVAEAVTDELGTGVFSRVTLPAGPVRLTASSRGACGSAVDATDVLVYGAPPRAELAVSIPAGLRCGDEVEADDDSGREPGVQIVVRVIAAGAIERTVEVTDADGDLEILSTDGLGRTDVTLAAGETTLVGVARDALGQEGRSAACRLALPAP